jgi:ubiquinone/menaquinone biosynthesis C-methylase UbiE
VNTSQATAWVTDDRFAPYLSEAGGDHDRAVALGEEWTASPEWKQGLIEDVLAKWIPDGGVVLEVGPGAGRWSEVLASRASRLVLADVSERPLELCRERFDGDTHIQYVLCTGSDLPGVEEGSIDAVWSFDVFVHVAPGDQAGRVSV